jgi:hypothetical protein
MEVDERGGKTKLRPHTFFSMPALVAATAYRPATTAAGGGAYGGFMCGGGASRPRVVSGRRREGRAGMRPKNSGEAQIPTRIQFPSSNRRLPVL